MWAPALVSARRALGLEVGCDLEQVRAAYKHRALETHPDKGGDVEEFREVRKAYDTLLDYFDVGAPAVSSNAAVAAKWRAATADPRSRSPPRSYVLTVPPREQVTIATHPQRVRKRTIEEEINCAFASIPHKDDGVPAAPAPTEVPPSARSPLAPTTERFEGRVLSQASKCTAAQLWAVLAKLLPGQRESIINKLDGPTKARLKGFLESRRHARNSVAATDLCVEQSPGSGSSSSASSSSSSSTSSAESSDDDAFDASAAAGPTTSKRRAKGAEGPGRAPDGHHADMSALLAEIEAAPLAERCGLLGALPKATHLALERYMKQARMQAVGGAPG